MKTEYSLWHKLDRSGLPLLLARMLLGGLFIYLGALKLSEPFVFLNQIRLYKMLPESPPVFLNGVAILLPWLEILAGAALFLGTRIRAAAALLAVMLAVFTPAILIRALNMRAETGTPFFQIEFDCGCGTGNVIIWKKLLENTGLFALAVYAVLSRARRFGDLRPVMIHEPAGQTTIVVKTASEPVTHASTPQEGADHRTASRHSERTGLSTPGNAPNLFTP